MIIETRAYARAGLLGNPTDGYYGKTISITVRNFGAQIILYESPELTIEEDEVDKNKFRNIYQLVESVNSSGYYGATRLIKACIKTFCEFCLESGIELQKKNFTIRFNSSIPRQVGLAGSSAIITATMKALMKFYHVNINKNILPTIVLKTETEELGINAGLQDRVIQVFEGCVYMDFEKNYVEKHNYGKYTPLPVEKLPKLYLAYKTELSKVSGTVLNNIREKYDAGDKDVIATLDQIAALADIGKKAIEENDHTTLNNCINKNFDLRCKIMNISDSNLQMVETARKCGASAKFSGSGGTIIGSYENDEMLQKLIVQLKKINARVIKPYII